MNQEEEEWGAGWLMGVLGRRVRRMLRRLRRRGETCWSGGVLEPSGVEGWALRGPWGRWARGHSWLRGQGRQSVWVQMLVGADVPADLF